MDKSVVIEAVALYWPMALCAAFYALQKCSNSNLNRTLTAAMMAGAWVAATLPWLNDICVGAGFWDFNVGHGYTLENLPLSLYVGWILLWGGGACVVVTFSESSLDYFDDGFVRYFDDVIVCSGNGAVFWCVVVG